MYLSMSDELGCTALHLLPPESTWIDHFKLCFLGWHSTIVCVESLLQTAAEDTVLLQRTCCDRGMGLFSFFFIQTFWHASGLLMHSSLKVWVSLLINFLWKILHSLVLACCRLLKMILKSATAVLKITSPKPKLKIPDQKTTLNKTKPNPHLNAQSFSLLLS